MAKKTKYLRSLEALRSNLKWRKCVSVEGRGYWYMHLLYEFGITRNLFERLKEPDELELDLDRDVDYERWSNPTYWKEEMVEENEEDDEMWSIDDLSGLSKSNLIRDFFVDSKIEDTRLNGLYKRFEQFDVLEKEYVDDLEHIVDKMVQTMCATLKLVQKSAVYFSDDDYATLGQQLYDKYSMQGRRKQIEDEVDYMIRASSSSRSQSRDVSMMKRLLHENMVELCECDLLRKVSCKYELSDYDDNDEFRKEIAERDYLNFRFLVDYVDGEYVINNVSMGKYVYANRFMITEDQTEDFYDRFFKVRIFKKMLERTIKTHNQVLTREATEKGLAVLVGRMDWEGLWNDGYGKEWMLVFFKLLLRKRRDEYKEACGSIWASFEGERDSAVCENVALKPFLIILGVMNGHGCFEKLSVSMINEKVFLKQKLKLSNKTMSDYYTKGKSNALPWPLGDKKDISANVYEYIKKIIEEAKSKSVEKQMIV